MRKKSQNRIDTQKIGLYKYIKMSVGVLCFIEISSYVKDR